jgi:hypothetical protein
MPIDKLAELSEIAPEGTLSLDLEEKDCEILFVPCFNDHLDGLIDICSVFDYVSVAGYLLLPADNAPLTHE